MGELASQGAAVRIAHVTRLTRLNQIGRPVTSTTDRRRTASTVSKAATVLRLLSQRPDQTSTEMARALDLDRTTVHRLLTTLAEHDLVHGYDGRWRLGTAAVGLGGAFVDQSRLRQAALPYAIDLQRTLTHQRGVVSIDVWAGSQMIVLERVWNRRTPLSMILGVGSRVGVTHTATGLAVLARLSPERLAEIPGTDDPEVRAAVRHTREAGGLSVVTRGVIAGLSAMASAITDAYGLPVGTLVIAGIDISHQQTDSDMARSLRSATRKASGDLNHRSRSVGTGS